MYLSIGFREAMDYGDEEGKRNRTDEKTKINDEVEFSAPHEFRN
jgi:hypothetical protein